MIGQEIQLNKLVKKWLVVAATLYKLVKKWLKSVGHVK
jgi:hypothetical protein